MYRFGPRACRLFGAGALVVVGLACAPRPAPSTARNVAPVGARPPDSDAEGCIPDLNDACPLVDGCPGRDNGPAARDDDGCPGPGGVPFAADCRSDERRLLEIAAEIQKRPQLTTLKITSHVARCAETVRAGLERAGVARGRIETAPRTGGADSWAYFEIAAWGGERCK